MGTAPDHKAARRSLPSGTVTFLLTDIEASTSHWQRHPDAMRVALARHDSLITRGVEEYHGTVLTERGEGDSVFAVFARASDALGAANAIQRALHQEPWPEGCTIRVRMAINTGEADEDYRGTVVNRCARLRSVARGGQVLLSGSVRELALDHLPRGTRLKDTGRHQLRGLDRRERVYQLVDLELATTARASATWIHWRWALLGGAGLAFLVGMVVVLNLPGNPAPAGPLIKTVIGTGPQGYSADGTLASSALITRPCSITVDTHGTAYVIEGGRVRKVRPDGTLVTVAGDGIAGFSGDGGAATLAQLSLPAESGPSPVGTAIQVAVDGVGDVFIPDMFNGRVREVTTEGVISTVAGGAFHGYAGDGGPATRAQLNGPRAVAIDREGNLFIADTGNNVIRRVDAATGVISTFAGSTDATSLGDDGAARDAGLNAPQGLAFDSGGNLYIADAGNERVRRVDATTSVITTVAGNGEPGYSGDGKLATAAELDSPVAVVFGPTGILFIADSGNNVVRRVDVSGRITTVAGAGHRGASGDGQPATSADLALPLGVAVDGSGALLIADSVNNRIRRVH